MKNSAFWNVKPCGSCKNRRFGGTYHLYRQACSVFQLIVTANVCPNSLILLSVMIEAIHSSESSVLTTSI
jgi:hypothetical protein